MTTAQTIAAEILNQLGGNRFIAMTGSRNFLADGNGLRMNLTRNKSKAQFLLIELNSMDTYEMTFFRIAGNGETLRREDVAKFEGVYCDQLQAIFTQVTGLYTKL